MLNTLLGACNVRLNLKSTSNVDKIKNNDEMAGEWGFSDHWLPVGGLKMEQDGEGRRCNPAHTLEAAKIFYFILDRMAVVSRSIRGWGPCGRFASMRLCEACAWRPYQEERGPIRWGGSRCQASWTGHVSVPG